jgi:hypothetical protein
VAAWWAEAGRELAPWRAQVLARLQEVAASLQAAGLPAGGEDLGPSIEAAANTLDGLSGRRVLLLLVGGRSGPPEGTAPGVSLRGVHLVVANVADPARAAAWTSATRAWGAAVTALGPALTQLELTPAVNG